MYGFANVVKLAVGEPRPPNKGRGDGSETKIGRSSITDFCKQCKPAAPVARTIVVVYVYTQLRKKNKTKSEVRKLKEGSASRGKNYDLLQTMLVCSSSKAIVRR